MIVENLSELKKNNFFAIIIGSGPAGMTTALELERKKIKTLIIEAGDIEPNQNNQKFLKGEVIGDDYNDLSVTRLRQFGGTSNLWGGNCNPMNNEDFNLWPIKKKDLDEYEDVAKEILSLDKKESFYLENFSKNLNIYNIVWSNVNFGEKYLNHVKKSKYIFLSLNTVFLNFNDNFRSITSIDCFKNNQKINLNSKFFILSCGGIENSRILLWAQAKNKKIFDSKLPIGKYYMDHPYHNIGEGLVLYDKFISYFKKINSNNIPFLTCNNSIFLSAKNNFIKNKNIMNAGLYFAFQTINEKNDLFKQIRCIAPNFIKNIYENLNVKEKYKVSISIQQEQEANIENKISLSDQKDPFNMPYPIVYWKKSALEKKSARLIAEELSKIFIDHDIGRISLKEYLYNDDKYEVTAGNHQLGGTRMGESSIDSVVDKNLKVHGKKNLFINGSSVFRTAGHSHPTYTIVKLAARLADHLSKTRV